MPNKTLKGKIVEAEYSQRSLAAGVKRGKAVAYAKWCASADNPMVPKYVKMQAEQWIQIVYGQCKDPKKLAKQAAC